MSGYSTGMRQRLGLAAALLRRPRLLLLDEPTSGLDPAGTRAVAALVRELAAQGVAVLLSSHQIGELEKVCDSYTMLRHGRVVWDGTAAELDAQAPGSAYALFTSDDARALALASRITAVRIQRAPRGGLAVAARPDGMDELVALLGDAHVLIRRLELIVSPLESMFFALTTDDGPAALDALERRSSLPTRSWPAHDHDQPDRSGGSPRARRQRGRAQRVRDELHKLMAQLTTRILILVCAIGPLAFAADPQGPERHAVRRPVRRLGPLVRVRDLARDPRIRGFLGIPDRRRGAGRRPVLLRGPARYVEDDPHPVLHA